MAEGLSVTAANELLTTAKTNYTWIQLHTAAPGTAGTTAVATESTRKQVTWTTTVTGATMSNTNALTWTSVAGTEDYQYWTMWSASTSGVFGFSGAVTANPVTIGDTFTVAIGDLDVAQAVAS